MPLVWGWFTVQGKFSLLGPAKWAWGATVGDRGGSRGTDSLEIPTMDWKMSVGRSAEGGPREGARFVQLVMELQLVAWMRWLMRYRTMGSKNGSGTRK